jgi:acyl carrier protein
MPDDEMKQRLLEFIRDHLAQNPAQVTSYDQPLISSGAIDSFALVELSVFIEEEFGVAVPDPEMTAASFDTVDKGMETIARYL